MLGHSLFHKSNGDILLSDKYLDQAAQYGRFKSRRRELTGNRTFFILIPLQVILSNGILSVLLERQMIVVLLGKTTTTGPTLEPCSIEGIFLRQIGKCQVLIPPPEFQVTMTTFSIL